MTIGETRNDRKNREAIRDDGISRRNNEMPVLAGDYCPICHYFNFLTFKSKDGQDICESCCRKEQE
jgi:hypothetical protein